MSSKLEMLEKGKILVEKFCKVNAFETPRLEIVPSTNWKFGKVCGYYRKNTITLCLERCAAIGRGGPAWSYPGYVADRTPYGVMAHELGHHVDFVKSSIKGAYGGDFSTQLRVEAKEKPITSYCPNDWEWFAEMFRLFCTNPQMLELIRPTTYRELIATGLKPVETRAFNEILKDAPQRTQDMAWRKVYGS